MMRIICFLLSFLILWLVTNQAHAITNVPDKAIWSVTDIDTLQFCEKCDVDNTPSAIRIENYKRTIAGTVALGAKQILVHAKTGAGEVVRVGEFAQALLAYNAEASTQDQACMAIMYADYGTSHPNGEIDGLWTTAWGGTTVNSVAGAVYCAINNKPVIATLDDRPDWTCRLNKIQNILGIRLKALAGSSNGFNWVAAFGETSEFSDWDSLCRGKLTGISVTYSYLEMANDNPLAGVDAASRSNLVQQGGGRYILGIPTASGQNCGAFCGVAGPTAIKHIDFSGFSRAFAVFHSGVQNLAYTFGPGGITNRDEFVSYAVRCDANDLATSTTDCQSPPGDKEALVPGLPSGARIFTHRGFAAIDAELARDFFGSGGGDEFVAFAYRESPKAAPPGASDPCQTAGVTWAGDIAQDAIYITSALKSPADLTIAIGGQTVTTVSLPVTQATNSQQTVIQIGGKTGIPSFILSRDGTQIGYWVGKLPITNTPATRTVSTYADFQPVLSADFQPAAWFNEVALDKQEGAAGETTPFTFRLSRNTAIETLTGKCVVEPKTASASDFVNGILPEVTVTLPPGVLSGIGSALVRGDGDQEADETFVFVCGSVSPSSYDAPTETRLDAIIRNDDAGFGAPRFSIRAVTPTITEGTGSAGQPTPIPFEILRLGNTSGLDQVDFCPGPSSTAQNSATENDFVGGWNHRTITFQPGKISDYEELPVNPDSTPEPDKTVAVKLLFPSAGTTVEVGEATALILDDDSAGQTVVRTNAGDISDIQYVDTAGNLWTADNGIGGATDSNTFDFAGTDDDTLFQTSRYGASTFNFIVAPGLYKVTGYFSESDSSNDNRNCSIQTGRRLILPTISASGGDTITAGIVDPYCEAGFKTADIKELATINAPQGKIKVEFRSATNSQAVAQVNAILVEKVEPTVVPRSVDWINMGAPEAFTYTDGGGNTWRGMPPTIASGCTSISDSAQPDIVDTEDDQLYWTRCQGNDINITIPITPIGSRDKTITMLFSEPTAGPGTRVADVYVNGVVQIADLDIAGETGGVHRALTKYVSPSTIPADDKLRLRLVAKAGAPALINGVSVTDRLNAAEKTYYVGWKQGLFINKADLIKAISPTGLSGSGKPIVIRSVDTTNSTVFVCHGACEDTATHGIQPDTTAANNATRLQIVAFDPTDPDTSLFPALGKNQQVSDEFTVVAAELLPGGSLGSQSVITVHVTIGRGVL